VPAKINSGKKIPEDYNPGMGCAAHTLRKSLPPQVEGISCRTALIIIGGDADLVPALKLARQEGMRAGLDPLKTPIRPGLSEQVDFISTQT